MEGAEQRKATLLALECRGVMSPEQLERRGEKQLEAVLIPVCCPEGNGRWPRQGLMGNHIRVPSELCRQH